MFLLTLIGTTIGLLDATIVTAAESIVSKLPSKTIFKLPPKGAPGPRTDSGSRDACPATSIGLTAIVPGKNVGQTLSDRPTIWAYVPFQATSKHQMEIEIKKPGSNASTITPLPLPQAPGIIQIPLPSDVPAMKVGDRYTWVLRYNCDVEGESVTNFVQGSIDRISLNAKFRQYLINAKTIEEKIELYTEYGIWFELIELLISEKIKDPNNKLINKIWIDLLSQTPEIDLKEMINQPINLQRK